MRELRKANEILRLASAFFARAELDRGFKSGRQRLPFAARQPACDRISGTAEQMPVRANRPDRSLIKTPRTLTTRLATSRAGYTPGEDVTGRGVLHGDDC